MSNDNKILGTFKLDGIAPAPRGTPQIEVTFDIDANGILNVTAKDQGTGKDQKITISGSSSMDEAEVERLKEEAEKFAEQDKDKKEQVQVRNELDTMVYQCEKQLSDLGEKHRMILRQRSKPYLLTLKKCWRDSNSTNDDLKKAKDTLQKGFEELGQEVMKSGGMPGAEGAGSPEPDTMPPKKRVVRRKMMISLTQTLKLSMRRKKKPSNFRCGIGSIPIFTSLN